MDLSNNNISDIGILEKVKFEQLEKLYLNNNEISDINILERVNCKDLKVLALSSNNVSDDEENYNEDISMDKEDKDDSMDNANSSDQASSSTNIINQDKKREDEKNQLALKIKKENESFMKSIEQGRHERLKFLLKQTEIFAHFLIGGKADEKSGRKANTTGTKRNKSANNNNVEELKLLKKNDDDNDLENMDKEITRLYCQPSI